MTGHRQAWELIPWVVNGRASDDERALVDAHLRDCPDCRDELAFQQQVHGALATEIAEPAVQPSMTQLWSRIDGRESPRPAVSATVVRWLAVAVVIEAIGLGALSIDALRSDDAPYRTLTAPVAAAPGATIRIVPADDLPLSALHQLLDENHLQIVGGPTEAGVLSLAPRDGDAAIEPSATLQKLRANPGVRFAEPVAVESR